MVVPHWLNQKPGPDTPVSCQHIHAGRKDRYHILLSAVNHPAVQDRVAHLPV